MRPPPPNIETPATFPTHWVSATEAERLTGRSRRTLDSWAQQKLIRRRKRAGKVVFEAGEILQALEINAESSRKVRFHPGNIHAGPGRPRHPARPDIATLLTEGYSVKQVMASIGCSRTLVRNVLTELQTSWLNGNVN